MPAENQPFFSIIIPTYNRSSLIRKTIESALNQTYSNFELIVVDDGSTDNTEDIVKLISDHRITYFKRENKERGASRNFGAKKAKGEFLYFLDSDDILYKNHLQVAEDFISKNHPRIFFQQYEFTKEDGTKKKNYEPLSNPINEELIKKGNFMSCHGVFIERKTFLENLFNEDRLLSGSEDYELWLRLASQNPIYYSPTITSTLIYHSDRSVLNMDSEKLILRKEKMLSYILNDKSFLNRYGGYEKVIKLNAYSYLALHLALIGERHKSIHFIYRSFKSSFSYLIKKQFLSTLKYLMISG